MGKSNALVNNCNGYVPSVTGLLHVTGLRSPGCGLNSSVYCFRAAFVILVSLSLLNQLAKGYVFRGQGVSSLFTPV